MSFSQGTDYYADADGDDSPLLDEEMRNDSKMRKLFKNRDLALRTVYMDGRADLLEGKYALMGHAQRLKKDWPGALRMAGWLLVPGNPNNPTMLSTLTLVTEAREAQLKMDDGMRKMQMAEDAASAAAFTLEDLKVPERRMKMVKELGPEHELGRLALLKHINEGPNKGKPGDIVLVYKPGEAAEGKKRKIKSLIFEQSGDAHKTHDLHVRSSMEALSKYGHAKSAAADGNEMVIPVVYLGQRVAEDAFAEFGRQAQKADTKSSGDHPLPDNLRTRNAMSATSALSGARGVLKKAHVAGVDISTKANIEALVNDLRPALRAAATPTMSEALRGPSQHSAHSAQNEIERLLNGSAAAAPAPAPVVDAKAGAPLPAAPVHHDDTMHVMQSVGVETQQKSLRTGKSYVETLIGNGVPEVAAHMANDQLLQEVHNSLSKLGLTNNFVKTPNGAYYNKEQGFALAPYSMNYDPSCALTQTAFTSKKIGDKEVAAQYGSMHEFGYYLKPSGEKTVLVQLPNEPHATPLKDTLVYPSYLLHNNGAYTQLIGTPFERPVREENDDKSVIATHSMLKVVVPGTNTTGRMNITETKLAPPKGNQILKKTTAVFTPDN